MPVPTPDASPGLARQLAIYEKGVVGTKPKQPIAIEQLEAAAKKELSAEAYDYLVGGAGAEDTMRANLAAFRRWRLVPRFLRNVARRDLSVELLGQRLRYPFLLAPVGVLSILHKKAELAVALAAKETGVGMVLNTLSSYSMEEVAKENGDGPRWFQLYWPRNNDLAASFVGRAEQAGFSALVVTLDTFFLAWRERDLQNAYLPFLTGKGLENYFTDPVFRALLPAPPKLDLPGAVRLWGSLYSNPSLTWSDLAFLRQHTRLPILLKGILDPGDAKKAVDHGVNGVIVSNHGGRQLDGAIAALDALPRVVDAIAGKMPVLFDSGIRRGADVLKAVALGARCVLLGRPYCFGLAYNGEEGVANVVNNLIADIDLSLGLMGCASITELDRGQLVEIPAAH